MQELKIKPVDLDEINWAISWCPFWQAIINAEFPRESFAFTSMFKGEWSRSN